MTTALLDTEIYRNLSFEEYSEIVAFNASKIKGDGRHSAKHLDAAMKGELSDNKDTPDRRLGRAIHCMMLEPERFADAFKTAPEVCGVTKDDGNDCENAPTYRFADGEWCCGVHKDRKEEGINPKTGRKKKMVVETARSAGDYVSRDELNRIRRLRHSIMAEPGGELLRVADADTELTIVWTEFGVRLKTRIDHCSVSERQITELKKMKVGKGDKAVIRATCEKLGYHIQAWFQVAAFVAEFDGLEFDANKLDQMRETGWDRPQHWFLFSEDSAPFCSVAMQVADRDLKAAQEEIESSLAAYERGKRANKFDGYQIILDRDPSAAGILSDWFLQGSNTDAIIKGSDDDSED